MYIVFNKVLRLAWQKLICYNVNIQLSYPMHSYNAVKYAKTVSDGHEKYYDLTTVKSRIQIFTEEVKMHYSFIDGDIIFHPEQYGYKVVQLTFG